MFPTGEEVRRGLAGVIPLFTFSDSGLGLLARDRHGAWRSFAVMALVFPIFLANILILQHDEPMEALGLHFFAIWFFTYLITWTLFPLVLLEFARGRDFEAKVPHFIVAYNWLALPVAYMRFIVFVMPEGVGGLLSFMLGLYVFALEWTLARRLLGFTGWGASGLVILAFFLETVVRLFAMDMTELLPKLQNP